MGAGEGKKKKTRNFGPPAFGPHPSSPHAAVPDPSRPHPWGLTFSRSGQHSSGPPTLRAPIPPGSTLRPPLPSSGGPPGLTLFLGLGPYVPHFYHVAHLFFCVIFNCFFFLSFSFLKISLFVFLLFFSKKYFSKILIFSSWGGGGGRGQTQNPN